MKEELLKEFKKEYLKNLKEKQNNDKVIEVLMERKKILENSPLVKSYIELNKQINCVYNQSYTEYEVFFETLNEFKNKGLMSETNDIYLYAGSFINGKDNAIRVERNSLAEFDRYINIESFVEIDIPTEDRDIFESRRKVIFADDDVSIGRLLYDIHEQFINDALEEGQESACKKVLSRNKKNL